MNIQKQCTLVFTHIIVICLSNILVQYPIMLFDLPTTWGSFTYPIIFILTDLTTRLTNATQAKKIIYRAMFPGLLCSYLLSNWLHYGQFFLENWVSIRIALASFSAYLIGQLADVFYFQKLRLKPQWWIAPLIATIFGTIIDTYVFFFIAFYQSANVFMRIHWLEIASLDLLCKLVISISSFLPIYGIILNFALQSQAPKIQA